jgi:S1-C subfamily serine protease
VERVLENAQKLCEEGRTRAYSELAAELERTEGVQAAGLPAEGARQVTLPQLYEQRTRGVLFLARLYQCDKCNRWHLGNEASAFALTADGLCVTCRHVFTGEQDGRVIAADAEGNVFPVAEVVAASEADDLALFRIDLAGAVPTGTPAPEPIPLRAGAPTGTAISVISHPSGRHYYMTRGIIARRMEQRNGVNGRVRGLGGRTTPVINITADYAVGSSGAPVLDDLGNAVGLVVQTSTIDADPKKADDVQMVVKTCVAAERVRALLGP